ncbi:restriction endonuclease subunit S [Mesorhizobium sp. B2-6-2]|uniref:restriction endonuclease subunit S n=1 Tax=Mesorhizobium sp. B2-6-2 TaxID=2589915 RepID=UPI00112AF758|nr:restriction endonuclease subunit S [Mesorhizobium sp. B2-6-2]TPJ72453.1 hypothetical protein FJ419_28055 [Mesorhizobium sp. B2-6-2]
MTTHWKRVRLGDIISIKHGYAFKSEYFAADGPYVVTTPGNFHDEGGFKFSEEKRKGYAGPIPHGYLLSKGALLVAMTEQAEGLLGSTAIIPQSNVFLHNQRLGLINALSPRRADEKFIYYLFNTRRVRQQIRASSSGTKVRHTSPSRIGEIEVLLPPLGEQRRVASILSAYDDLIENNTRRTEILKEVARRIYEEWFVHFRAPGGDDLPLMESPLGPIPEGWAIARLGEVIDLKYGKALKADHREVGPYPVYGSSGVVGTHIVPLVEGPGIVVGRKGNVGSVHWSERSFFPIDTAFYVSTERPLAYIFQLLMKQRFLNSDAAVPGLNRNQALSIEFVLPPVELMQDFAALIGPINKLIFSLAEQNRNLCAQRDLLLPKLIYGEIDVSQPEELLEAAE